MKTEQLPLVTFEQAKRLKELGFDWETYHIYDYGYDGAPKLKKSTEYYNTEYVVPAPTVSLALKWFREEKNIVCHVITQMKHFRLEYRFLYRLNYAQVKSGECYIGYEAAESALLDELLDILEKEKEQ
jgi:hypothetical protein